MMGSVAARIVHLQTTHREGQGVPVMAERFDTDGALITGSVAARIFHLQTTHQEGESAGQHQIEQSHGEPHLERAEGGADHFAPRLGEIRDGDDGDQRGVLMRLMN